MGVSWLSECIHIELHGDHTNMVYCNFYLEVFLRVIGGLNMIRGFFIFLVFIYKPKILQWTEEKHPKLWGWLKYLKCSKIKSSNIQKEIKQRKSLKFDSRMETVEESPNKTRYTNPETISLVNMNVSQMNTENDIIVIPLCKRNMVHHSSLLSVKTGNQCTYGSSG